MSGCINKIMLLGYLGADPQIREVSSGKVASFSLATSDSWTDKEGERQEKTQWHRVIAYNGLAEIAERFLKKRSRVYLEGQLQTRTWTDGDGTDRLLTMVVLNKFRSELVLLDQKNA
ncbi:MAG: single-stranded DNA-binding protein [Deltaproteobacteria bacterium]|nr:single-stranded DNA-binding protein [Deltaproteobacteria bacterium]